jgi:hypothetical protein
MNRNEIKNLLKQIKEEVGQEETHIEFRRVGHECTSLCDSSPNESTHYAMDGITKTKIWIPNIGDKEIYED